MKSNRKIIDALKFIFKKKYEKNFDDERESINVFAERMLNNHVLNSDFNASVKEIHEAATELKTEYNAFKRIIENIKKMKKRK